MSDLGDGPCGAGATAADAPKPVDNSVPINERVDAVEEFIDVAGKLLIVGDLSWAAVEADYRLLAINSALRRQMESMQAATVLARKDLGHLAVAFVRASLEDVMYLGFFSSLDLADSQKLFLLLGNWDATRSLLAQRAYVGDDVMARLWYSEGFLDDVEAKRDRVRAELRVLQKQHKWAGGDLPSGAWVAERANKKDLYEYLHAATSRALHFSAGEIMRRGWGQPTGIMTTNKPEFREHLASFALDQLVRLYTETWIVAMPLIEAAGVDSDNELSLDNIEPVLSRVFGLGKVPLVHAAEWNLTPNGPLTPNRHRDTANDDDAVF